MLVKSQKNISISLLKPSSFNPPNRENINRLRPLMKSLQQDGQLLPLLVTKDNVIIDGHHRWSCAKLMGLRTLFCLVVEGKEDSIYAAINTTAVKLSSNDSLGVWLKNPNAVSINMNTRLANMEGVIGRELMEKLYAKNMSANAYNLAKRLAKLAYSDNVDMVKKIVSWFITFQMVNCVAAALREGESPDKIMKAVKTGRPIKMKIAVDED